MAKARTGAKTGAGRSAQPLPEDRTRMIAEAAYYRALRRGFEGGDPVDDWLAAEREINQALPKAPQQREEAVVYDKLRAALGRLLAQVQESVNAESVRQAFDRAIEEVRTTGTHTAETIARAAASLRKDMASAAERLGPEWEDVSRQSGELFDVWRDRGARFLAQASAALAEWLEQTGIRLGRQTYRAGEMAYRGSFECTACGERVVLDTAAHLPSCPRCRKLEYRRL